MDYRNAKRIADGRIDCEINHPEYGWIPFTADASDAGAQFDVADLFARADSDPNTKPYDPPPPVVPSVVSRFQARAALMQAGLLDQAEAAVLQAGPLAQLAWADAQEFRRNSPTINSLAALVGLTEAQIDALFISASQIEA